ncbi:MAG: hypothetical protein ACR2FM_00235 [Candidatus Saccharimonadales bacterium]
MDVMNLPSSNTKQKNSFAQLLKQIQNDFTDVIFTSSDSFYWSGESRTIYYDVAGQDPAWSLLHELGHMVRAHNTYNSDTRLVQMEMEAWETAKQLAPRYGLTISDTHIQDCIDSYRSWQHLRSKCPKCEQAGIEKQGGRYHCINCQHNWRVTDKRFCRVYRMKTEPS